MSSEQQYNFANGIESSLIGIATSWLVGQALPWAVHSVGAIATACITAFVVFHFNRWMKRKYNEKN